MNNSTPDMGDNNLAATIVRAITMLLMMTIVGVTSCQMHRDYQQGHALTAGINPVGISCVYSSANDCALTAASK